MSTFYGNILKHFQEAFSALSFKNFGEGTGQKITVNAENTKAHLTLEAGDKWLKFSGPRVDSQNQETIVTISHNTPDLEGVQNDVGENLKVEPASLEQVPTGDLTDGICLILETPSKDEKGHLTGKETFQHKVNLNIEKLKNGLSGAMHFKGILPEIPEEIQGYANGDVIVVGFKEYVFSNGIFIELGDVTQEREDINTLMNNVKDINNLLSVIQGEGNGSINQALEDAKTYTNTEINSLVTEGQVNTNTIAIGTIDKTINDPDTGLQAQINKINVGKVDIENTATFSHTVDQGILKLAFKNIAK